jgi:hypothetical protein
MEIRLKDIPAHVRLRRAQGVKAERRTYRRMQVRASAETSR